MKLRSLLIVLSTTLFATGCELNFSLDDFTLDYGNNESGEDFEDEFEEDCGSSYDDISEEELEFLTELEEDCYDAGNEEACEELESLYAELDGGWYIHGNFV